MQILVKFPSRGRPRQMFRALGQAISLAQDNDQITYVLTLDNNDLATNNEAVDNVVKSLKANVIIDRVDSTGKIDACNRGIEQFNEWDIVLLLSDDMICQQKGWDNILRQEMSKHFPDTDGVLFHNDGFCQDRLNTLCILGRKYFDRFGYIYNPIYISLFSDNEFMEVAYKLKKQKYFSQVLFKHEHPANTGNVASIDDLYNKNEKYFYTDKATFEKRKQINFGL